MLGCTKTRWSLSAEADGATRTAKTTKHLSSCAKCSAFARTMTSLGDKLRAGSSLAPPAPEQAHGQQLDTRGRSGRKRLAFGGALVGAAAVAAVFVIGNPGSSDRKGSESLTSPTKGARSGASNDTVATVDPSQTAGASQGEIDNSMVETLAGDARGGLRYVLRVSGLKSVDRK